MREVRNGEGETQLWYFCRHGMTSSVARMLAMRSIDVEGRDGGKEDGWTCLMTASRNGHFDICRLLIDKGAQLEAKNCYGWTPLHIAASEGYIEIVRLLCDRGADVQARDDSGSTPLHFAARCYHISVVEELVVERNVDINARNKYGSTAYWDAWASEDCDDAVTNFLVSHGAETGADDATVSNNTNIDND
jgi:ankyrin repeat protein